jgi:ferritin-like metal-binding protein YciE
MYCYILYDSFTKSLCAVYDDEKKMKKDLNKLVLRDMEDEIMQIRLKILDETGHEERQLLMRILDNIEVQRTIDANNKTMYFKNGDAVTRYYTYTKEFNKITSPIFFS